jgi:hypothetical protein
MENNFNWKRFWNLFHYEYAKVRALCVGILIMAVALVLLGNVVMLLPNVFNGTVRTIVYFMLNGTIGFIYIGLILTSVMFGFSGSNKTLIPDLMIPASNAEKFGAKFLVYWLIPTLFAFAMIWVITYVAMHYQTLVDGQWVNVVKVNGVIEIDASAAHSRWLIYRFHFFLYLCFSGLMMLVSAIFFKYADPKKFGGFVGITIFVVLTINNYVDFHSLYSGSIYDYLTAENCRVTIFQLALGLSIVAVCTAIAYRRFCRLTIK